MLNNIVKRLEKTKNINRSTYVWNAVSATMLAMQSPVILMVLQRTNGTADAGIFSIAIAIANLMMYVGQYGIRRFQASDVKEQFSFEDYHGMRIITCTILIIASLAYGLFGMFYRGYSQTKFAAIFMVCMLKFIQAYSDVYHGNMQQKGRFDVAAKATAFRYTFEIVILALMLIATHNLLLSTFVCVASSIVVMFLMSVNAGSHYCKSLKPRFKGEAIKGLFIEGFPLFVSMFLNTYIGNAPKYAIDAYLTDDVQAIFNYIFMPAFVVQIVAQFIFNPIITDYARLWHDHTLKSYNRFVKSLRKMSVAVLGLTLLGLAVAATIGIPVLSIVFGVDLAGYKKELCIIMLGGGMLAYATYFSTVIAIIRIQKTLVICYGVVSAMALILSKPFVAGGGIVGASWMYVMLMAVLAVALFIAMYLRFAKERKELETVGE